MPFLTKTTINKLEPHVKLTLVAALGEEFLREPDAESLEDKTPVIIALQFFRKRHGLAAAEELRQLLADFQKAYTEQQLNVPGRDKNRLVSIKKAIRDLAGNDMAGRVEGKRIIAYAEVTIDHLLKGVSIELPSTRIH